MLVALVPACHPAEERSTDPGAAALPDASADLAEAPAAAPRATKSGSQPAFAAIAAHETIRFTGTEPFWGGTVGSGQMVYSTPENQAGETIAVRRFAGNNGLGFSGTRNGAPLDLTITPGSCSDGMSDRAYPFTATLRLGEEQRNGCAWTERSRSRASNVLNPPLAGED